MEHNEIHESIAQQIDHMRPPQMRPGYDVGIEILDESTVRVVLYPHDAEQRRSVDVRYDAGPDTYTVTAHPPGAQGDPISDVYCDQLGELIFGNAALPWRQPFGGIQILDEHGDVESETTF